jgi:hypothetical protein
MRGAAQARRLKVHSDVAAGARQFMAFPNRARLRITRRLCVHQPHALGHLALGGHVQDVADAVLSKDGAVERLA